MCFTAKDIIHAGFIFSTAMPTGYSSHGFKNRANSGKP